MLDHDTIYAALASGDPNRIKLAYAILNHPLSGFVPRADQPERLDQQTSFFNDEFSGIACAIGGNGSGKSFAGAAKVARFLETQPPPEKNTPFWIVSTKLDDVANVCWQQNLRHFIPADRIDKITWLVEKSDQPRSIKLRPHSNGNNFTIEFKSYDQGRSKFQGSNIVGFWLDEQAPPEIINEVLARTRKWVLPGSKIYTLTPIMPDLYLEEKYNEQERYPTWKFYRLNTRCNTTIDPDYVRRIEESEHPCLVETRLSGAFAQYEGMIFPAFGKQHTIDPIEIPKNWLRIRGLDLGFKHATACVWVAVEPGIGRYYVYREYNKSQSDVESHIQHINGANDNIINGEAWEEVLQKGTTWADHAAAQELYEYQIRGLLTQGAYKDMDASFAAIRTLLRPARDGKPLLQIFNTCQILIQQMRTYVYDPKTQRPVKETDQRLFDVCDAMRYCLSSHYHHQQSGKSFITKPQEKPKWKQLMEMT